MFELIWITGTGSKLIKDTEGAVLQKVAKGHLIKLKRKQRGGFDAEDSPIMVEITEGYPEPYWETRIGHTVLVAGSREADRLRPSLVIDLNRVRDDGIYEEIDLAELAA